MQFEPFMIEFKPFLAFNHNCKSVSFCIEEIFIDFGLELIYLLNFIWVDFILWENSFNGSVQQIFYEFGLLEIVPLDIDDAFFMWV